MLLGEELRVRVVEWIRGRRDSVIVSDRDCCHVRLTHDGCAAVRIKEQHGERFIAFNVGIVINQNSKALSGFAGVKGQLAGNNSEVATNRCHTVGLLTRSVRKRTRPGRPN